MDPALFTLPSRHVQSMTTTSKAIVATIVVVPVLSTSHTVAQCEEHVGAELQEEGWHGKAEGEDVLGPLGTRRPSPASHSLMLTAPAREGVAYCHLLLEGHVAHAHCAADAQVRTGDTFQAHELPCQAISEARGFDGRWEVGNQALQLELQLLAAAAQVRVDGQARQHVQRHGWVLPCVKHLDLRQLQAQGVSEAHTELPVAAGSTRSAGSSRSLGTALGGAGQRARAPLDDGLQPRVATRGSAGSRIQLREAAEAPWRRFP